MKHVVDIPAYFIFGGFPCNLLSVKCCLVASCAAHFVDYTGSLFVDVGHTVGT